MEVVGYDRQLANFEALECVRTRRKRREAGDAQTEPPDDASGALAAEVATEQYLSKTPAAKQEREAVSACWRALSEHPHFCRLTTPEKLQLTNHRPLQPVAVHLMIEDCHRRFREDELVEELIALWKNILVAPLMANDVYTQNAAVLTAQYWGRYRPAPARRGSVGDGHGA